MGRFKDFLIDNKILLPFLLMIQNLYYKLFSSNSHQISNFTLYNRYPKLFMFAKKYFVDRKQKGVKILCYGCSTGEECFSLNDYFDNATIYGIDNNKKVLARANKNNRFPNIKFFNSTTENMEKNAPFDIIFAMAVFCRWPASGYSKDISQVYPFTRFNDSIDELDKLLSNNGLLIFNNSNFLFSDTSVFSNYEVLETPQGVEEDIVPKFSKENKYLGLIDKTDVIFRKLK